MTLAGDDETLAGANDLVFDGSGNLVFTSPTSSAALPWSSSEVNCLRPDGTVTRIAELENGFPNGVQFGEAQVKLYVADTFSQNLLKGDWDPATATWSNVHEIASFEEPAGPEGRHWLTTATSLSSSGRAASPSRSIRRARSNERSNSPAPPKLNITLDPDGSLGLIVCQIDLASVGQGRIVSIPELGPGAPPVFGDGDVYPQ